MRRVPSRYRNAPLVREREQGALVRLALILGCGLVLAGGFVYAGIQQFGALRLGYQTEKLRAQLDTAREEQRRLTLEREAVASPARLERAARQLGMQPLQAAQINPLKAFTTQVTVKAPALKDKQVEAKLEAKLKPDKQKQDPKKHR
jgi:cell division protein FtsL